MTAHTPDALARSYTAAQRDAAADRLLRRVALCTCGAEYTPTPDGRRVHQMLHGHRPTPGGDAA